MKSILTICPSLNRPSRCFYMAKTFKEKTIDADLIVVINDDESFKESYKICSNSLRFRLIETKRRTVTEIYNDILVEYPDYKMYHIVNDDFIFITNRWDKRVLDLFALKGEGVFYCNDLMNGKGICVSPIISNKLAKLVGFLQLPELVHLCGDCVWHYIGNRLNRLFYLEDVIIEHKHFLNKKSILDSTYQKTNSKELYEKDNKIFREWINSGEAEKVINRIKMGL